MKRFAFPLFFLACTFTLCAAELREAEKEYYRINTLPIPEGISLEAGALQWLGKGRLAVSSRYGDIYMIDNALDESGAKVKFTRFASGLHEVLGLAEKVGGFTPRSAVRRRG